MGVEQEKSRKRKHFYCVIHLNCNIMTVTLGLVFFMQRIWYLQANKFVRIKMNVSLICQTIINPPKGDTVTRADISCKISYTANGKYLYTARIYRFVHNARICICYLLTFSYIPLKSYCEHAVSSFVSRLWILSRWH